MEEIKEFITELIELEFQAHMEHRKRNNMEQYMVKYQKLENLTVNNHENVMAEISFGVHKMTEEHDEEFFEDLEYMREVSRRMVYKISKYDNPQHGEIYAFFTSLANSESDEVRLMSNCFVIGEIEGELRVISQFIPKTAANHWKKVGGFDLKFSALGKYISTERLLEPLEDEWSVWEYNQDR